MFVVGIILLGWDTQEFCETFAGEIQVAVMANHDALMAFEVDLWIENAASGQAKVSWHTKRGSQLHNPSSNLSKKIAFSQLSVQQNHVDM